MARIVFRMPSDGSEWQVRRTSAPPINDGFPSPFRRLGSADPAQPTPKPILRVALDQLGYAHPAVPQATTAGASQASRDIAMPAPYLDKWHGTTLMRKSGPSSSGCCARRSRATATRCRRASDDAGGFREKLDPSLVRNLGPTCPVWRPSAEPSHLYAKLRGRRRR